ncbi:MAG: methyltransferase domain-containing protein [Sphingomonas sp.]|uniref:class I SAM-dependent methyltransferase n=1 Tax=Sphingomonas sp. TaxID=28214 RepID=UPI001AC9B838|nr:methyltransferase domain-containing protein [Sphingomonas sp.]MBN8806903.1 methyltransferase domain-containing protein [Sphingomonas sp.]
MARRADLQTAPDVVHFHDARAEAFASRYRVSAAFQERAVIWATAIRAHVTADSDVLDLGCGSGIFSFAAAEYAKTVIGIDGSASMIALCNSDAERRGLSNAFFERHLIENVAQEMDRRFDVVLCSSVLEYLDDLPGTLKIIAHMLRPSGTLIFSMPNQRSWYRSVEKVLHRLTGRPRYFGLVKANFDSDQLRMSLDRAGLGLDSDVVFGNPPASGLMGLLPGGADRLKTMRLYTATKFS